MLSHKEKRLALLKSLNIVPVNGNKSLHLTTDTTRMQVAKRKIIATQKTAGLNHSNISLFLKTRLNVLYKRARIDGALTNDNVSKYLASFTINAAQILQRIPESKKAASIIQFTNSTKQIIDDISEDGCLLETDVIGYKQKIQKKSNNLYSNIVKERIFVVESIGLDISDASVQALQNTARNWEYLPEEPVIPTTLEEDAEKITLETFFSLPFKPTLTESGNEPFDQHLKYLELLVKNELISNYFLKKIKAQVDQFKLIKYRKNFDIFQNKQFDHIIFAAIIDIWKNNGLPQLQL